jgi:hypothetical protein
MTATPREGDGKHPRKGVDNPQDNSNGHLGSVSSGSGHTLVARHRRPAWEEP